MVVRSLDSLRSLEMTVVIIEMIAVIIEMTVVTIVIIVMTIEMTVVITYVSKPLRSLRGECVGTCPLDVRL